MLDKEYTNTYIELHWTLSKEVSMALQAKDDVFS